MRDIARAIAAGGPALMTGQQVALPSRRRFRVLLIKPSHYDDDGYVIRWYLSLIHI